MSIKALALIYPILERHSGGFGLPLQLEDPAAFSFSAKIVEPGSDLALAAYSIYRLCVERLATHLSLQHLCDLPLLCSHPFFRLCGLCKTAFDLIRKGKLSTFVLCSSN